MDAVGDEHQATGRRVVCRRNAGADPSAQISTRLWTLTAIEPGRSFTWVSRAPGLRVVAHHSVEPTVSGSRATLSLELQGVFGGVFGRLTRGITERYLALEASGLKARSEDAGFRHGETGG